MDMNLVCISLADASHPIRNMQKLNTRKIEWTIKEKEKGELTTDEIHHRKSSFEKKYDVLLLSS